MSITAETPIPTEAPDVFQVYVDGEHQPHLDTVEGLIRVKMEHGLPQDDIDSIRHLGRVYDDGKVKIVPALYTNKDYFVDLYKGMPPLGKP